MLARRLALCVIVGISLLCGGCTLRVLEAPSFQVTSSDDAMVHRVIREALENRRWTIVKEEPGAFEASYRRPGGATARIRVSHSRNTVTITHVDSSGLDYQISPGSGEQMIHKTYNGWIANLQWDIETLISARRS